MLKYCIVHKFNKQMNDTCHNILIYVAIFFIYVYYYIVYN